MSLTVALREYIAACFTPLWVTSHEHEDALSEIAQLCRDHDWRLATWYLQQGLRITGQHETESDTGRSKNWQRCGIAKPNRCVRSPGRVQSNGGTSPE